MKLKLKKKDDGGEVGPGPRYNFSNVSNPTAKDSSFYKGSFDLAGQMSPLGFRKEFLDPYTNASKNAKAMSTSPEYLQALQRNYYIALNAWQDAHSFAIDKKEDGGETGDPQPPRKAIKVGDPKDPRLKAYNDSLTLYKATKDDIPTLRNSNSWKQWSNYVNKQQTEEAAALVDLNRINEARGEGHVHTNTSYSKDFPSGDRGNAWSYAQPVQPYVYTSQQKGNQLHGDTTNPTTYTTDPNDPRLIAYQDSLRNYDWSNSGGRNLGKNVLFPDDVSRIRASKDTKGWSFIENSMTEQPQYFVANTLGTPNPMGAGSMRNYYAQYPEPKQPYTFKSPPPPPPQRTQVQSPQQLMYSPGNIEAPTGGPGQLAGGQTSFSFTGRDSQGQQVTRYFPDLSSWQNATNQIGYSHRETTNNDKEAHATGYQFKDGGMKLKKADIGGGYSPVGTPLAQTVQPPNTMKALPGMMPSSPNMIPTQPTNDPNNPGGQGINWDHVLASFVATNLAQGAVSRFSPNSQQNTTQQFNRQQFSPTNFLPYTPNNSIQAQYGTQGMRRGGTLMEDGGIVDSEAMRKWILGDDTPTTEEQEDIPQAQQQEDTSQYDAQQFAMFAQMFGLDQADGEKEPEQQDQGYMQKKGGSIHIKKSHEGRFTAYKKRTGKTTEEALHSKDPHVRKMANFAKNASKWHHAMGGLIGDTEYSAGQEVDVTPEQYAQMIQQGYQFE